MIKEIKGYEGLYTVSDNGAVYSLRSNKELVQSDCKGYNVVALSRDGKPKTFRVHRLVAEAFIPNPDNLPEVDHIDENTRNNAVSNLEWCSSSYNLHYGSRIKRSADKHKKAVDMLTKEGKYVKTFPSIIEAVSELGLKSKSSIGNVLAGRSKTAAGYQWRIHYGEV